VADLASRFDAEMLRRWSLLPLRLFLGVTFTFAGLQKLADPRYLDPHSPTSVQSTMLALRDQSPIGWLLSASAHAPVLVGVAIAIGELSVGLATLVGLWVRLAAAGGMFLSLTFFLTVSFHTRPYYYGSDIVFLFAWTVPLLAGAWSGPTVDAWVRRRAAADPDPRRRALVLGGIGAGVLAIGAAALAGITAAAGRALRRDDAVAAPAPSAAPVATTPAATQAPSPTGSSSPTKAPLPGRHLARASDVSVGHALRFSQDDGSPAWLLHESNGEFRAFSAVCTHAGCTVNVTSVAFDCPCHGGSYDLVTGAVLGGPPPSPLTRLNIQVVDGDVRLV
jgi:thiosulfate dehydrogenase [quinone] large subunit